MVRSPNFKNFRKALKRKFKSKKIGKLRLFSRTNKYKYKKKQQAVRFNTAVKNVVQRLAEPLYTSTTGYTSGTALAY